ncbi:MAG: hypothetical protein II716_09250 [Treponema sp.]|nr:hypothetical protein [Treponema sp.]
MKGKFFINAIVSVSTIMIFSCRNNDSREFVQINAATEISRLQNENERLIRENESLKSSLINENKLRGKIEYNYTIKAYELTKSYINVFTDLFPASNKIEQFRQYYELMDEEEKKQKAEMIETEIAEQQKSMADYTGIWKIYNFIDENGNATNKTYITNGDSLSGTYSDLSFDAANFYPIFMITAKNNISMMIYERDSSKPVSGSPKSPIKYNVKFTDSTGSSYSFVARNTSDRINFGTAASAKLHSALLLGGTVKFELSTTRDSYPVKYEFQIPNAQFYNTAARLMGIL